MDHYDFNLFVIGAGSGGVRAARMAAQSGASVAIVDSKPLGGTCVNLGCIPKKLYSYASAFSSSFHEAAGFGWEGGGYRFNWETLKRNRATEISRLNRVYENLLDKAGVRILRGHAEMLDAHTVQITGEDGLRQVTAENILVVTGGRPVIPDPLQQCEHIVTSDQIFDLPHFPAHLLIIGGGYIACEFASIFNGLGSKVVQICRGEQILRGFDEEVREFLASQMRQSGVDLQSATRVTHVSDKGRKQLHVTLSSGTELTVDTVLVATGRTPNVEGLGLDAAGVKTREDGAILVDDAYRTSAPSVFALGDVTARIQLTPVAIAEAMILVDQLYGKGQRRLDYEFIPTAVFTHPNVGTVGYSEHEARAIYGEIATFKSEFRPLKQTLGAGSERTFMKLVVDKKTDRVVGLHMVGDDAGELVQGFAVAIKAGATKAVFDQTVGIHPTAAEEFVTMRTASA